MRRPLLLCLPALFVSIAVPVRADVNPIRFAYHDLLPSVGGLELIADLDGNPGPETAGIDGSSVLVSRNLGARQFAPAVAIPFGPSLLGLEVVDLDRDGRQDLAVLRYSPPALLVRPNLGGLSFGGIVEFAVPANVRAFASGDLDGDGWQDLVVVTRDTVVAFLNNGAGLDRVTTAASFGDHAELAVGDVDGDSRADLVTSSGSYPSFQLAWRHGNGDGSFGAPSVLATGASPGPVIVADLDHDGTVDVVHSEYEAMAWHRGLGAGAFATSAALPLSPDFGPEAARIAVGDLDGDGALELFSTIGRVALNAVQVLRAPTTLAARRSVYHLEWHPQVPLAHPFSILVADLDGDGRPEPVAGVGQNTRKTVVMWNDGAGRLGGKLSVELGQDWGSGSADGFALVPSRSTPGALPDLVSSLHGQVRLTRNAGDGTFLAPDSIGLGGVLAADDLDHDGDDDLVVTSGNSAWVLPRLGAGGFGAAGPVYSGLTPRGLADFNGDGEPDLALSDSSTAIWIRVGDGAGGFGAPLGPGIVTTTRPALWFGDVDDDGLADVAWAEGPAIQSGDYQSPIMKMPIHVARNQGMGQFVPWDVDTLESSVQGGSFFPGSIHSGDVDGDGDLDLILMVGGWGSSSLGWWGAFLNDGTGQFSVAAPARFGGNPGGVIEVADMNGDGMDDVLLHESDGLDADFHAFPALGGGLFGPLEYLVGDDSVVGMAVADFDGDARPDVALLASYYRRLAILRNVSDWGAPTPALVSNVAARLADGAIELEWYSPEAGTFAGRVERRLATEAMWAELAALTSDGSGRLLWRDTGVRPGERHGYRLRYRDGAAERTTEEVWVEVPGVPRALRLAIAGRQPVAGPLAFDLAAPEAGEFAIEILDVSGRRLATRRLHVRAPGTERVTWEGAALAPGLYFARATGKGTAATTRFAIVR